MLGSLILGSDILGSFRGGSLAQTYNPAVVGGRVVFSTAPVISWGYFPIVLGPGIRFRVAASHICGSGPWPIIDPSVGGTWSQDAAAAKTWTVDPALTGSWTSDTGRSGC